MIQAFGLTSDSRKEHPPAVDDVSFEARAGRVTALLGAPGAGKSTALRLILELQQGRGLTYFRGRPLHRIAHPSREVGVLLGDVPGHPARTVRGHLRMLCAAAGVPVRRADEVLEVVGLSSLRDERLGTLSRGMDRRLGLACALLGDPHTLVLDEPAEGLSGREDRWLHGMLRAHALHGGTVLMTTADPKEAARTADRVVTLERGRLVADQEVTDFARTRLRPRVAVRSPHAARLAALLTKEARTAHRSVEVVQEDGNRLCVYGSTCAEVGETAFRHGILVHQLADETGDMGPGAGTGTPERPQPEGEPGPVAVPRSSPTGRGDSDVVRMKGTDPEDGDPDDDDLEGELASEDGPVSVVWSTSDAWPELDAWHAPAAGSASDDAPSAGDSPAELATAAAVGPPPAPDDPAGPLPAAKTERLPLALAVAEQLTFPEPVTDPDGPDADGRRPGKRIGRVLRGRRRARSASGASGFPTMPRNPDSVSTLPPPISVRSAPSPLRPLRYELRRAAGIGTSFLTGAAVLLASALLAVLLARAGHTPQARLLAAWPAELPLPPAALGAGLLGALAFGDEFRHPALAADRGTVPRRLGLLTAKLLVAGLTALMLAFLTVGCDAEVLYLLYGRELAQVPAEWVSLSASWLALVVGCAWAGVLAAGVFRSTTAGLAAVLAVPVAVVPLAQRAAENASVRTAAGFSLRLREVLLVQWPFGGERYLFAALRVIAQPVGGALALSLTALLGAYVLMNLRSRVR
ncbi:ABC transporter ATP-binding protein [Streptomyces sp. NBC_00582]|uniref:ABC transporter ATP-binding protein n=1 Tax=Streptomyces sp. NBC_00582 TaxID=2975783 RepID=UPI002E81131F|nr:ABC transporter ATP-binding protein [Streptomyces sp. NBC_00582]WUB61434.1 ABC transporter ATP-binding protein [Streptomyces sp. NBC_00582]